MAFLKLTKKGSVEVSVIWAFSKISKIIHVRIVCRIVKSVKNILKIAAFNAIKTTFYTIKVAFINSVQLNFMWNNKNV